MDPLFFVIFVVILAWIYNFFNGANDCANAIAATVSCRALKFSQAVVLAAFFEFLGALATTEVAKTIGKGIISEMTPIIVLSAIIGAIIWAAFATFFGIPVSITHCIVGGIIGAGIAGEGAGIINWAGLKNVIVGMFTSPLAGFIGALLLVAILLKIFKNWHPSRANFLFSKGQIFSTAFLSFSHGANDAQNAMGIITIALLAGGFIGSFEVPLWVILGSAFFMSLGTFYGGKRVIKTVGMKIVKLKPVYGFAADTASAGVITFASFLGIPISTTHVTSTAIMGVGSIKRFSAVKWGIAGNIIVAWVLTIPVAAFISFFAYKLISFLF